MNRDAMLSGQCRVDGGGADERRQFGGRNPPDHGGEQVAENVTCGHDRVS